MKFQEAVETSIEQLEHKDSLKDRAATFTSILTEAASTHVGKVKPGRRSKTWMNPAIRTAIRKRNRLRRQISTKREEWLASCREVNEAVRDSKTESWRNLLDDAIASEDDSKLWSIIHDLNGTPDGNAPNEAMIHNGRIITSNERKSELFMQHYAAVSRLNFSAEERDQNRRLKKILTSPSVDDESSSPFTMSELKKAIRKMKKKGAAGPDEIPPAFLKALGPKALYELLAIFNQSFESALCPQIWRLATVIPLLKKDKPASELASFRPISLTSCIGKLLERMVAERLYHLAETRGWFNHQQAGFRKGRSCEDQIIRITQAIEDGLQQKKDEPLSTSFAGLQQSV